MQDDEIITFEDRTYQSPTVSRDSQLEFIDTLRNVMGQKQNEVNSSTYALGSQLPSNLGGLGGGEPTFEARYRTPQLEQTAANLRTAAQQSALNTALSNLQTAYKKRYNDAVLNYQRRAANSTTKNSSTGSTAEPDTVAETIEEATIDQGSLSPDGSPNAVVSGPAGTTATNPDGDYTVYTNDKGESVRQYNDGHLEVLRDGKWVRTDPNNSPIITQESLGGGFFKLPLTITGLRRPS